MSMHDPLTKSQALLWIGCGIAVAVGATFGLLKLHASATHLESITKSQFDQYFDNQKEWRSNMRQDIIAIKQTQDTTNQLIIDLIRDSHREK